MRVIGITGTIGSGKSTVTGFLSDLGAKVIDADEVGHEVYLPGNPGWKAVIEAFGNGIIAADGAVDRHKLGEIVFENKAALAKLNYIMHPLMANKIQARLTELRQKKTDVAVMEAAILLESGWDSMVDEIWVTTAPENVIFQRLATNRKLSPAQARARIKAQLPVTEQLKLATHIIDTSVSLDEVRAEVIRLWRGLVK